MNLMEKSLKNCIQIRFIWYVWYHIGWFVPWCRITFRCHNFYWWVNLWWWRVTWCHRSKYLWSGYWSSFMYQIYRWWKYLFYFTNNGWIIYWSDVCRIIWNKLIRVGVIRFNVNRVRIFVIPNYRIFVPNIFNFKIIFALSIFENVVASRFLTLNFCCVMPQQYHVGDIIRPVERVEYVSVAWDVRL